MKKILGLVVLSLFAISASATDLMALSAAPGAQPAMSQNTVVEGSACPGIGATGFSSTGLLLSCQSGSWRRLFRPVIIVTTVAEANTSRVNGLPPDCSSDADKKAGQPNWANVCGNRSCMNRGFNGGLIQEWECLTSSCAIQLTCF